MNQHNAISNVSEEIVYQFTTEPHYLRQYAELVIEHYRKELELDLVGDSMAGDLSTLSANERVFVVRDGERVVAGAKLTLSSRSSPRRLPMEVEGFRITELLPDDYREQAYAEIGRLVVDPEYRGKEMLAQIIDSLATFTRSEGGGYLFVQAPPLNAVLYRRVCRGLAMRVEIHKGLEMRCKDAYSHLQLQLLSCDIRGVEVYDLAAAG